MSSALSLREQVDRLLPGWESWYPSLFDAARDLGLIRAYVCPPSSLLLSNRHARIQQAAEDAHRNRWGGAAEDVKTGMKAPRRRHARRARRADG